jgi:hypothetical protein
MDLYSYEGIMRGWYYVCLNTDQVASANCMLTFCPIESRSCSVISV